MKEFLYNWTFIALQNIGKIAIAAFLIAAFVVVGLSSGLVGISILLLILIIGGPIAYLITDGGERVVGSWYSRNYWWWNK